MSTNEPMTAERLADARAALDEDMSQWGGEYGADLLAEVHRLRAEIDRLRGKLADAWDDGCAEGVASEDSIYWNAVGYRVTNPYRGGAES